MPSLLEALAQAERDGDLAALCTVIRTRGSVPRHAGSKMLVWGDGRTQGTIGGGEMENRVRQAATVALQTGEPQLVRYELVDPKAGDPGVCGGEMEIFVDPVRPHPTLLVIGGGHVGKALVALGHWLNFHVILADDRPEFCNSTWAPGADQYLPFPVQQWLATLKFHAAMYIVMPTRNVLVDVPIIPLLLEQPHAYLGVIGSRRRWATTLKHLAALGLAPEKLARIHAPMGLDLKAETPEEIALSVLAEVVAVRYGGTGQPMRHLTKPAATVAEA